MPFGPDERDEAYEIGREARQRHPILARAADVVGVLLIVGVIVWLFFLRN